MDNAGRHHGMVVAALMVGYSIEKNSVRARMFGIVSQNEAAILHS